MGLCAVGRPAREHPVSFTTMSLKIYSLRCQKHYMHAGTPRHAHGTPHTHTGQWDSTLSMFIFKKKMINLLPRLEMIRSSKIIRNLKSGGKS